MAQIDAAISQRVDEPLLGARRRGREGEEDGQGGDERDHGRPPLPSEAASPRAYSRINHPTLSATLPAV